ncbi:glycoside hydrolase [Neoconidiobolus thromboides FSU 785]|nr:glycoside hydrolase [Neoconidiobolus thromboides FSU 785]
MSRVIGYYTSWSIYDRNYQPTDVLVEKLTHINYAFADIKDGEIALGDPWADAQKPYDKDPNILGNLGQFNEPHGPIRQRNPNIKVLISVGGWTFSKYFSVVASTEENRVKFANSILNFLIKYKLDGVDLDWEFPVEGGHEHNIRSPQDGYNFTLLLNCIRNTLNQSQHKQYLLTIATSAAQYSYQHLQLNEITKFVDYVNIMTYDFTGPWSQQCHHQSNLLPDPNNPSQLSCFKAINDYISGGIRRDQIVMGVPFYARGFTKLELNESHPPTSCTGYQTKYGALPPGKAEAGVYQYHELHNDHLTKVIGTNNKEDKYFLFFNETTKATHLYDPVETTFISFDDPQSLAWKCFHVKTNGLGGIMIWELYGDYQNKLVNAICSNLCT